MTEDAAAVLARAHSALRDGAAVNKRSIAAHRRALSEQKKALAEIEEMAKAMGLRLHINDKADGGKAE